MDCPDCGDEMVAFRAPASVRDAAPGDVSAICPRCLTLAEADDAADSPDFSRIVESFPRGEAGATMAVAVGLLVESVVLHRETIARLLERVQDADVDPWLVLERLAASPTIQADADLERASLQLEQLLDR